MGGPAQVLTFLICILLTGLSIPAAVNSPYSGALTNPVQSPSRSPAKDKTQYVKFGVRILNKPVNQKYSLAFGMEPAEKSSPFRKGKVTVGTRARAEVRIILDIPGRVEDKKEDLVSISSAKKDTGGMSTFQTTGRGDLPMEAKLILKDLSGKTLDAVLFEALGERKENGENSDSPQTSVEKQSGINKSRFFTEPAILELRVSTGSFCSSVITILNEEARPLHIKAHLHYILVKSPLSSFFPEESGGYFPDAVVIEPSELDLQPGEEGKISIIPQVPQEEEERYYARVVLELGSPEETSINIKRRADEEFLTVSRNFKEISSNCGDPLEFMVTFKKSQLDFVFPDGIRNLKGAYNKRLPSGEYIAEVSFKQGDKMLISQSSRFCVEESIHLPRQNLL